MDPYVPVYSWIRGGSAIFAAKILTVDTAPAEPGQEEVRVTVQPSRTLWGSGGSATRSYAFLRPASTTAQLKFPDPVWGRVDLARKPDILVVALPGGDPVHVDPIESAQDPVLWALGALLAEESRRLGTAQRVAAYRGWMRGTQPVQAVFGAQALAGDDLPEVDPEGGVAADAASAFLNQGDVFVRLAVGAAMWTGLWPRTTIPGRLAILRATLLGVEDRDPDVRRFAVDQLTGLDDRTLLARVDRPPEVVRILREQFLPPATGAARERLDALIRHLAP